MDTNVQALKELYVSLGGKASDVADMATSSEVITAMKSVAASAASELPAVTASDYGKVLKVGADGKWSNSPVETFIGPYSNGSVELLIEGGHMNADIAIGRVLISGKIYVFQKSYNTGNGYQYLNVSREEGKTVYRSFVVSSSDPVGAKKPITVVEVPDPTVPEA